MMTNPITYQTFWAVYIRDGPSLWSILHTTKDLSLIRGLAPKSAMVFIILTMIFVLAFPTLSSAMTGYSANNRAMVNTIGVTQAPFSQFLEVRYVIHDGDRINKGANYAVGGGEGQRLLCGSYSCIDNCEYSKSSDHAAFLISPPSHQISQSTAYHVRQNPSLAWRTAARSLWIHLHSILRLTRSLVTGHSTTSSMIVNTSPQSTMPFANPTCKTASRHTNGAFRYSSLK